MYNKYKTKVETISTTAATRIIIGKRIFSKAATKKI